MPLYKYIYCVFSFFFFLFLHIKWFFFCFFLKNHTHKHTDYYVRFSVSHFWLIFLVLNFAHCFSRRKFEAYLFVSAFFSCCCWCCFISNGHIIVCIYDEMREKKYRVKLKLPCFAFTFFIVCLCMCMCWYCCRSSFKQLSTIRVMGFGFINRMVFHWNYKWQVNRKF